MHFSSFVNNTATIGNAICYQSGSVNAKYNWWGSNINPSSQVSGSVDVTPWLYMTITVDTSSISYGNTCNAVVSFNNAYDGTTIIIDPKVDGHIPDGTTVNFSSTLGTFDHTTTTTTNGTATTTFTATSLGTGNINAATDSETLLADITVIQAFTIITVNNVTSVNGKTVNLTAKLKDENGNILTGKTVTFIVNGVKYTAVTDDNGIATVNYKLTKVGVYTVTVNFVDGTVYANSTGNGTLTVNPAANIYINTTTNKKNPTVGETFLLTYKLGNKGPNNATNVTVTFQIPKGLEFVNVTADTGKYTYNPTTRTVTWTIDSIPVGDPYLYLTVKAAEKGTYQITPKTTSDTYNLNSGHNGNITIKVQSKNNNSNNGTSKSNNSINRNSNSGTTVNAASKITKTVGLQDTGLPLNYLLLAVLMVIGGLIPKRR